ncbi:hypothetical protein CUMW_256780 [Citrus unshiu]|uniref:Serine-threonine/tyrosine-protein kinase catalytic domain-containing protein n=1 Tax=Citrus unshiu TaxID=55188 RepID=A0A2H5QS82_CITUN|nr:hypothetical protein CUMW_256780 [Citrus unshiu]
METVDPSFLMEVMANKMEECLIAIIRTSVFCLTESPFERMKMRDVVAKLCHARETFCIIQ